MAVSGHHEQVALEIGCRAQNSWGEREEEKALPGPQQTGAPRRMGRATEEPGLVPAVLTEEGEFLFLFPFWVLSAGCFGMNITSNQKKCKHRP